MSCGPCVTPACPHCKSTPISQVSPIQGKDVECQLELKAQPGNTELTLTCLPVCTVILSRDIVDMCGGVQEGLG